MGKGVVRYEREVRGHGHVSIEVEFTNSAGIVPGLDEAIAEVDARVALLGVGPDVVPDDRRAIAIVAAVLYAAEQSSKTFASARPQLEDLLQRAEDAWVTTQQVLDD